MSPSYFNDGETQAQVVDCDLAQDWPVQDDTTNLCQNWNWPFLWSLFVPRPEFKWKEKSTTKQQQFLASGEIERGNMCGDVWGRKVAHEINASILPKRLKNFKL